MPVPDLVLRLAAKLVVKRYGIEESYRRLGRLMAEAAGDSSASGSPSPVVLEHSAVR